MSVSSSILSNRDSLGWAVLINFLVFVTLPVPLKYTGLLLGIGSFAIYDHTIFGLAKKENFFWAQVSFTTTGNGKWGVEEAIKIITI